MNGKGVFRTASAIPGLVIIYCPYQDLTQDSAKYSPLHLEVLLGFTFGNSLGKWLYLTIHQMSRPNTETGCVPVFLFRLGTFSVSLLSTVN